VDAHGVPPEGFPTASSKTEDER
jgi:hypothetical protein